MNRQSVDQGVNEKLAHWILAKGWLPQNTLAAAIAELRQQPGQNLGTFLTSRGLLSHVQSQELMLLVSGNGYYSTAPAAEEYHYPAPSPAVGSDGQKTANLIKPVGPSEAGQSHVRIPGAAPYHPGQSFGPYVIEEEISRGGMGAVVKAYHRGMDVHRALKFHLNSKPSEAEVTRFRREAAVLANLEHPNVLRVTDFGVERGYMFFAMELIDGKDLHYLVQENYKTLRIPPEEVWLAKIWAAMANALALCHSENVVHRDIKPQNILIEAATQRPVLCDFGLIKRVGKKDDKSVGSESSDRSLTKTGEVWGTLSFMSPEQLCTQGEFGEVCPSTDIWGLGASFFFAITGHYPYAEDNVLDLFKAFKNKEPRRVKELNSDASDWIDDLCRRCLQRRSKDRITIPALIEEIEKHTGAQFLPPLPGEMDLRGLSKASVSDHDDSAAVSESAEVGPRRVSRLLLLVTFLAVFVGPFAVLAMSYLFAAPRFLELQAPPKTSQESCQVSGRLNVGRVDLLINNVKVTTDESGRFSQNVKLQEGLNSILVTVEKYSETRDLEVLCDLTPPKLSIDGQSDQSVFFISQRKRMKGRVFDENIARLLVNNKALSFNEKGDFSINLEGLDSNQPFRLKIQAWDSLGLSVEKIVVIFGPDAYHHVIKDRLWWNLASKRIQDGVVSYVEVLLGKDYQFNDIQRYWCGRQEHRIASFIHKKTGIVLQLIPGGEYFMGPQMDKMKAFWKRNFEREMEQLRVSGKADETTLNMAGGLMEMALSKSEDSLKSELPRHKVALKPFLMGRYELSFEQWQRLSLGSKPKLGASKRAFCGLGRPRIASVLAKAGLGLRLPSESEWEYACLAGSQDVYYWGEKDDPLGHVFVIENAKRKVQAIEGPDYKCNAFGLYNMLGNVEEWCSDDYVEGYQGAPEDGSKRRAQMSKFGVVRGGSAQDELKQVRCGARGKRTLTATRRPQRAFGFTGVRVVVDLPDF
jgi:serine/threonine protein kinase/formylglycine-generating enzyme required for sulfatase activity